MLQDLSLLFILNIVKKFVLHYFLINDMYVLLVIVFPFLVIFLFSCISIAVKIYMHNPQVSFPISLHTPRIEKRKENEEPVSFEISWFLSVMYVWQGWGPFYGC